MSRRRTNARVHPGLPAGGDTLNHALELPQDAAFLMEPPLGPPAMPQPQFYGQTSASQPPVIPQPPFYGHASASQPPHVSHSNQIHGHTGLESWGPAPQPLHMSQGEQVYGHTGSWPSSLTSQHPPATVPVPVPPTFFHEGGWARTMGNSYEYQSTTSGEANWQGNENHAIPTDGFLREAAFSAREQGLVGTSARRHTDYVVALRPMRGGERPFVHPYQHTVIKAGETTKPRKPKRATRFPPTPGPTPGPSATLVSSNAGTSASASASTSTRTVPTAISSETPSTSISTHIETTVPSATPITVTKRQGAQIFAKAKAEIRRTMFSEVAVPRKITQRNELIQQVIVEATQAILGNQNPVKDLHLTGKMINLMARTREAFRVRAACAVERAFELRLPLGNGVDEVAHKRAVVSELLKRGLDLLHKEVLSPSSGEKHKKYFEKEIVSDVILGAIFFDLKCGHLVDEANLDPVVALAVAAILLSIKEHEDGTYDKVSNHAEKFMETYWEVIAFITDVVRADATALQQYLHYCVDLITRGMQLVPGKGGESEDDQPQ
ncbi:hypothetical protein PAXINDRAFT_20025 [Paxillus involutus ATCC 200175]|uniref:DUF6532 domain-containing protein n=1 Tax=Paxillus involutus ATCC 200175 TaxID=664439 RepID=A0A0C9TF38_PAXIN|nr:hypothetical protein PAXINDRAFT_20025 [Paxillus involutus ATCC 200175]